MEYNKNKHLKLLKSLQKSENSRKIFLELQAYSVMMTCHLHWENREQYFELIEKLLNGPINFLPLRKKHRAIEDAGDMLEAGLILLEPNPKSEGFDELIDELVSLFDRFCPEPSLRESHEFSEEDLRKLMQKIFIEMKDRYP